MFDGIRKKLKERQDRRDRERRERRIYRLIAEFSKERSAMARARLEIGQAIALADPGVEGNLYRTLIGKSPSAYRAGELRILQEMRDVENKLDSVQSRWKYGSSERIERLRHLAGEIVGLLRLLGEGFRLPEDLLDVVQVAYSEQESGAVSKPYESAVRIELETAVRYLHGRVLTWEQSVRNRRAVAS